MADTDETLKYRNLCNQTLGAISGVSAQLDQLEQRQRAMATQVLILGLEVAALLALLAFVGKQLPNLNLKVAK